MISTVYIFLFLLLILSFRKLVSKFLMSLKTVFSRYKCYLEKLKKRSCVFLGFFFLPMFASFALFIFIWVLFEIHGNGHEAFRILPFLLRFGARRTILLVLSIIMGLYFIFFRLVFFFNRGFL